MKDILNIRRGVDGEVSLALEINAQTKVTQRLMVDNTLNVRVSSVTPLDIEIGDYVMVVDGNGTEERYELFDLPQIDLSGGLYSYDLTLLGNIHRLGHWVMKSHNSDSYYYFGTLSDQLKFILSIIETKEAGWTHIYDNEGVDHNSKNIDYSSHSCLGALQQLSDEFEVEFNIAGKEIFVSKSIKTPTELEFSVGRGEGLYKISRGKVANQKIVTRMYGYGSKTNILNEKRLVFDERFLEQNIDLYGLREDKVIFEEIYPRRNSTITSNAQQVIVGYSNWTVEDSTMDFDLNDQILEDAKIVFTSGDCAGFEFAIKGYDHTLKMITFMEYADEGITPPVVLPNELLFPRKGDSYHYINIIMPDSYVVNAKLELKDATRDALSVVSTPIHPYTVEVDPRFLRDATRHPKNGDLVRIKDKELGLDAAIRVIAISFPVINPNEIELTINDNILISAGESMMREVDGRITEGTLGRFHPLMGNQRTPLHASSVAITNALRSQEFTPGLTGARLNQNGYDQWVFEVDRVIARVAIETPELIKNRITITNNQTWFSDNGQVESVEDVQGQPLERIVKIFKDKVGASTFKRDDLLRGVIATNNGAFQTIYLTVLEEIEPYTLRVSVDLGGGEPEEGIYLVRTGNRTDTSRQTSIFINAAQPAMFYYVRVGSHTIATANIAQATGNLQGYNFGILTNNQPITERFSNVIRGSNYQSGRFFSLGGDGFEYPIPVDRGVWNRTRTYYQYDRVFHAGSMWDCAIAITQQKPGTGSDWTERVESGADGDYFEYRYQKNSSDTTAPILIPTISEPNGWTTTIPSTQVGEYVWYSVSKKNSEGSLIQNWSPPSRHTGTSGERGEIGASLTFRGNYSSSETYYGTPSRVDVVKYGSMYYVARTDAGNGFKGKTPTNTLYWKNFGAEFSSVATDTLFAQNANVANWVFNSGKLYAQTKTADGTPTAMLDGNTGELQVVSDLKRYTSSQGFTKVKQTISVSSQNGAVTIENTDNDAARLSSQGIYANRAGINPLPLTTGVQMLASVSGLGQGQMTKGMWNDGSKVVGVYGDAYNSAPNPTASYGGYFNRLYARGLTVNTQLITTNNDTTVWLTDTVSAVINLGWYGRKSIYLPPSVESGFTLFIKNAGGSSTVTIYPRSGQQLADDSTLNDSFDAVDGQALILIAAETGSISNPTITWFVNRIKY